MSYYIAFFLIYGLFAAASEGISKAWITNISDRSQTATAVGAYSAFQSIAALIASSMAGFIWYQFGSIYLFLFSAAGALIVAIYIFVISPEAGSGSPG